MFVNADDPVVEFCSSSKRAGSCCFQALSIANWILLAARGDQHSVANDSPSVLSRKGWSQLASNAAYDFDHVASFRTNFKAGKLSFISGWVDASSTT